MLENLQSPEVKILLEKISYEGKQSSEFDEHLRSGKVIEVRQTEVSEATKKDIILSTWHRPCYDIITRDGDNAFRILHVQPSGAGRTNLTMKQRDVLKTVGEGNASAITVRGESSRFSEADVQELEEFNITHKRTIDVDDSEYWRLLYDPNLNEIWIDMEGKKLLIKYRGF
jgi:hypothetical protein